MKPYYGPTPAPVKDAGGRRPLKREAGLLLHDVQDDVRDRPVDVRDGQQALDEAVEVLAAAETADDERIPVAGHVVDGGDVRVLGDLPLRLQELALGDADGDDGRETDAEILGVDDGHIALDDPGGLEPLDRVDDGGGRGADLLGDLAEAPAGVGVQGPDDLAIELIDHGRHLQLS